MGGFDDGMTHAAEGVVALVVGEEEDNVEAGGLCGRDVDGHDADCQTESHEKSRCGLEHGHVLLSAEGRFLFSVTGGSRMCKWGLELQCKSGCRVKIHGTLRSSGHRSERLWTVFVSRK